MSGLVLILTLAIVGVGGAGMLPLRPGSWCSVSTLLLVAEELDFGFLGGMLIETLMVSPCLRARSSFSG